MPKDSTVSELDELHKQAKKARARLEPEWYLSLAYYQNEQWVAWDGRQLHKPSLRRNRITVVENRILGVVRTELAKMTKQRPVFTVTPRTGDEQDANAAELAEQLMRYLWKHLHMHELSFKGLEWSRICGAGFLKCYWDSSVGDKVDVLVGPSGNVLTDAQGKPMRADRLDPGQLPGVSAKSVAQGDIKVEVRSPFQMFVDPLADTFVEAEWVVEESIKSEEYIKRRYGVTVRADTPANPGLVEARMGMAYAPGSGGYKGVRVREYWSKPSSAHPKGRRAVWVPAGEKKGDQSGQLLYEDDKPFDPMPYVMLSSIPVPGRLWPMGIVEPLRGPQTELNKVRSQMAENRNRVGNPTILASKQAVQDPEKFADATTMPGGIYFYDDVGSPNAVPKYLEAPPLPNYVTDEVQRIEQAIEDISGQHEVTNANVPPGVTAASAITLLMEADDTRLGPAITDYEVQLGRFGQKVLKLAAAFYTDARTIRIGGDNGNWQIFDFRGTMLKDNTHVEVQAGSAFPQSKAAKHAMIQDFMTFFVQSGNPPHGRQLAQFMKDAEMGGLERLMAEYTNDETQVNRENQKLAQGMQLPINDFDNDQSHIDGHTDFQKAQRYALMPPRIQQLFEQHVSAHRQRQSQQAQEQMQAQMQMQGQPPPEQQAQQAQMEQAGQQQELQGQAQEQDAKQAQAQQQLHQASQQQGFSAAQQEQQQRQAEELHQLKLRHQTELHHSNLSKLQQQAQQQAEQHAAQLEAQRAQAEQQVKAKQQQMQQQKQQHAQQSKSTGGPNGR